MLHVDNKEESWSVEWPWLWSVRIISYR